MYSEKKELSIKNENSNMIRLTHWHTLTPVILG